ncbi:MAG TPA: Zn-binding domain-containing protein, partial [Chthonomonadales bacterium]|nr:Zn-binding domain-containing protein [Chthonomonadales bacterium]
GGLDAVILTGYPGTIASAWQQAGRAGRGRLPALSMMVAFDNPLDQFLMNHPDYFFARPHEQCVIDPYNRRVMAQHILCAAYEKALTSRDLSRCGPGAQEAAAALASQEKLILRAGKWYYTGGGYPAAEVNIRSASADAVTIVDQNDRLLGTVESGLAARSVHPGAVYLHQGETYVVDSLDLERRAATVHASDAHYYTESRETFHLTILNKRSQSCDSRLRSWFGDVEVTSQVVGYRRKGLYNDVILAVEDLDLPEQSFETQALWFTVPPEITCRLLRSGADLDGSIHAIEHAAIGLMPLFCSCDRWDLGGLSHREHPDTGESTIFIFDAIPGGIGLAESAHSRLHQLLLSVCALITKCPCAEGCPSCIQSPKCGNNNEPLHKGGARYLLELLTGKEGTLKAAEPELFPLPQEMKI